MGDAGSIPLGFLAATIGLTGWQHGNWPWWFFPLVFSPFIMDATITLLKRLIKKEKVWQAHRAHYYQRLVQSGFGHRFTALGEYVLMILCGLLGLWLIAQSERLQFAALSLWLLAFFIFLLMIEKFLKKALI